MRNIWIGAAAFGLLFGCGAKSGGEAAPAPRAGAEPAEAARPAAQEADPVGEAAPAAEPAAAQTADAATLPAPALWKVDAGKSTLTFTGTQTGKPFSGQFSEFDAAVRFHPQNLDASSIEVTVDMTSAKTGDRQRDDALPTKDWFSSAAFPTAKFSSSEIVAKGANAYEARGDLKIRDASKEITLPFTLTIAGDRATADGSATIVRSDYGVGQGEFVTGQWVGLEVEVDYHIEATR